MEKESKNMRMMEVMRAGSTDKKGGREGGNEKVKEKDNWRRGKMGKVDR